MASETKRNDWFLLLLLGASLTVNMLLAFTLTRTRPQAAPASRDLIAVGAQGGAVEGLGLDGKPVALNVRGADRATLMYVFTTKCPWCKKNAANVRALLALKARSFTAVGVALETNSELVRDYLREHGLAFDSVVLANKDTVQSYHLGGVPTTIMIGTDGRVQRVWQGAYLGATARQIETDFSLTLPGLPADDSSSR